MLTAVPDCGQPEKRRALRAAQAAADTVAAMDASALRAAQAVANVVNAQWPTWFGPS
jgi:hypothetical protein